MTREKRWIYELFLKELLWNDLLIGQVLSGRQRVVGVRVYMEPFTGIK